MYIYIDIIKDFSCEMCGSCCRNDWSVTLGKESYERNLVLFEQTGRKDAFEQIFIPFTEEKGLDEYAYIAKKPQGGCWFLGEENRCQLHAEAGHEHLDTVCQIYPRYPMNTARGTELTLSFSCPAVIRLASRQEPLQIIRSQQSPIAIQSDHEVVYVYPQQKSENDPLRYYFEIEQHFIDIMQCRGMSIAERLHLISQTVQRIHDLLPEYGISFRLNPIFNENYDRLDGTLTDLEIQDRPLADVLLENFFVNFIFKKPFYIYGLQSTAQLLLTIWQRISEKRDETHSPERDAEYVKHIIMEIELEYSHNRRAFFK